MLMLLLPALTLPAAQAQDSHVDYRCAVLGESSACESRPAPAAVRIEESVIPGPYAQYLMHLGTEREAALGTARAAGEVAAHRVLRITRVTRSAQELYLQSIGAPVRAGESVETLSQP